jgi:hypothetical protein
VAECGATTLNPKPQILNPRPWDKGGGGVGGFAPNRGSPSGAVAGNLKFVLVRMGEERILRDSRAVAGAI